MKERKPKPAQPAQRPIDERHYVNPARVEQEQSVVERYTSRDYQQCGGGRRIIRKSIVGGD